MKEHSFIGETRIAYFSPQPIAVYFPCSIYLLLWQKYDLKQGVAVNNHLS